MRIMSLNVNRFSGMKDRDYTKSFTKLDECPKANEIVVFVKGFLCGNPDGLVYLYEIPYCRAKTERPLYGEFLSQFSEKNYKCAIPKDNDRADSCTIAIWNKNDRVGETYIRQCNFRRGTPDFRNKFIELAIERGNSVMRVLGIHAPSEMKKGAISDDKKREEYNQAVKIFFEDLKNYAVDRKSTPFILAGDLNVREGVKSIYLEQIHEIIKAGYSAEIKDGEITYFMKGPTKGTTIDHVLVSPVLKDRVTAYVVPQEILKLSDHAVIIVDVQI